MRKTKYAYVCIYGILSSPSPAHSSIAEVLQKFRSLYCNQRKLWGRGVLLTICPSLIATPAPTLQIPGILDVPEIQRAYTLVEALCILLFSVCTGQEKSHCYSSEKPS